MTIEQQRKKTPLAHFTHRFDVPKPIEGGKLVLSVTPRRGDEPCSIGRVELR
jgi:hypothetical protein